VSKHVALINTKTDCYGLYSYHNITQLDVNLKYCHCQTIFLKKAAVSARCSKWRYSVFWSEFRKMFRQSTRRQYSVTSVANCTPTVGYKWFAIEVWICVEGFCNPKKNLIVMCLSAGMLVPRASNVSSGIWLEWSQLVCRTQEDIIL